MQIVHVKILFHCYHLWKEYFNVTLRSLKLSQKIISFLLWLLLIRRNTYPHYKENWSPLLYLKSVLTERDDKFHCLLAHRWSRLPIDSPFLRISVQVRSSNTSKRGEKREVDIIRSIIRSHENCISTAWTAWHSKGCVINHPDRGMRDIGLHL